MKQAALRALVCQQHVHTKPSCPPHFNRQRLARFTPRPRLPIEVQQHILALCEVLHIRGGIEHFGRGLAA